jgi:hypothetical protein
MQRHMIHADVALWPNQLHSALFALSVPWFALSVPWFALSPAEPARRCASTIGTASTCACIPLLDEGVAVAGVIAADVGADEERAAAHNACKVEHATCIVQHTDVQRAAYKPHCATGIMHRAAADEGADMERTDSIHGAAVLSQVPAQMWQPTWLPLPNRTPRSLTSADGREVGVGRARRGRAELDTARTCQP